MEPDYESLPNDSSTAAHMVAGACAGIMEHSVMYPVDCVKTRLQCIRMSCSTRYMSLSDGLYRLFSQEGLLRSFRGIGAMVVGAGPAHALYFGLYEHMKIVLADPLAESNHLLHALSGASATLVHDAVMTPADAVKQRLQMFNSPYHNSWDCFTRVIKTEGISTLYRAYLTQLSTNIPFQSIHFVVYEFLQDRLNPSRAYLPWTHIVCGGLSGGVAAAVTTPMDVCKTILNTQPLAVQETMIDTPSSGTATGSGLARLRPLVQEVEKPKLIRGFFSAARFIVKSHGLSGFFLGLNARIATTLPGTAISWSVYEYYKWLLSRQRINLSPIVDPRAGIPSTVTMESGPVN